MTDGWFEARRMMMRVFALLCVAAVASTLPAAVPIPEHQVGTSVAVTGVCWHVTDGATFEHTFGGLTEAAVTLHFADVTVGHPTDIEVCVASGRCRRNHKSGHAFWTAPLGLGNATAATVRIAGPSSGCIDQMAQLRHPHRRTGGGSSSKRLDPRQHMTLGCSTDVDDTIAAKCSAAGACNPMPAVYDRAAATASIMFSKNGGWFVCTAWASSTTGHMFTNNHCVSTQDVADTVEFFFGCEMGCPYDASSCNYNSALTGSAKCGRCDMAEAQGTPCYSQMSGPTTSGATLLRTSSTYDYTLLRVKTPSAVPCFADPNCPMRLVPSNYLIGYPNIFMFQHSAGKPKLLNYFDSPTPGHLTTGRLQIRGKSAGCYAGDLAYDADAVGGSSGSVVALAPDYCNPGSGQM
jgi:hypothetical protein